MKFPGMTWTRRHFLMSATTALTASAQPRPRRNVLFIASDDLNHSFSAYGHPVVHTPNLDSLGEEENTTVVFWSDHGYGLGEHGQWMKQTVFEYAARSPLMICGAGVPVRGQTCGRTVEFLDLYPTLADLCGLKDVPNGLHGKSLRPLLENPRTTWERPAITQVQRARQGGAVRGYSLRTERHRYTMWDEGREGEELYDYSGDPRELKNLATTEQESGLKASLKSRLQTIVASRQASPRPLA